MKRLTLLLLTLVMAGCSVYQHYPANLQPVIDTRDRFVCSIQASGALYCFDRARYNLFVVRRGHDSYSYWHNYRWTPQRQRIRRVVPPRSDRIKVRTVRPQYKVPVRRPTQRRAVPRTPQRRPEVRRPPTTRRPTIRVRPPTTRRVDPPRRGGRAGGN